MENRVILLLQQGRFDLAEKELRFLLSKDPDNWWLHAVLAECLEKQNRYKDAEEEIHIALSIDPSIAYVHYVHGLILLNTNRIPQAKKAIQQSIELEPDDADYYCLMSAAFQMEENWKAMLEWAEKGLELEPSNQTCLNYRAMALVKLGQNTQAHETIRQALSDSPNNAFSHANLGWSYLHANDPAKAMEHFKESLRINPDMTWARDGLIEALKAKYLIYRLMLQYFLWMSRLNSSVRFGFIIGIYILFRILSSLKETYPSIQPFVLPFLVLYLIFVFLSWTAQPIFNFLIQFNYLGKYSLKFHEKLSGRCTAACIIGGLGSIAAAFFTTNNSLFVPLAFYFFLMIIPLTRLFQNEDFPKRHYQIGFTLLTAGLGIAGVLFKALDQKEIGSSLYGFFFLFTLISMWIGAIGVSRSK